MGTGGYENVMSSPNPTLSGKINPPFGSIPPGFSKYWLPCFIVAATFASSESIAGKILMAKCTFMTTMRLIAVPALRIALLPSYTGM